MKKILTFSLLFTFGLLGKSAACDCIFIPTFCESITFNNNGQIQDYLSVHRIKVTAILGHSIKATVHQTYAGDILVGHQLTILDGSGADCVLIATGFLEEEAEYIIGSQGNSSNITLGECGVYFLKVENDVVTGAIAPGITSVPLADFHNTVNCGDLTPAGEADPGVLGGLEVRPTIVTDEVEILTKSFILYDDLKVTIYDLSGKPVYHRELAHFGFYTFTPQIKVDMSHWSAGMYFIRVEAGGGRFTEKLLKVSAD